MSNGRFRKKKVYFTQVSNTAIRDKNLSLKAKGLYSLIQSYITMDDFTLYKEYLMTQCKEGRDAFNSTWKELKNAGYLIQYKIRDEKGSFCYEYELLDIPEPNTEEQKEQKEDKNKKSKQKTKKVKEPKTNNEEGFYPHTENPPLDETDMDKSDVVNRGCINNTNSNNTKLNNTKSSSSNIKKEEDDKIISSFKRCNSNSINISLEEIERLFTLYSDIKVIRAIEKAIIASNGCGIIKGYNYIATIIDNSEKTNITNINITNNKKPSFNNFTQRERTEEEYADLENRLLGWDIDEE